MQHSLAGGAIIVSQCNITIINSTLKENNAEIGGAIFGELHSYVTIINSTFWGNSATSQHNISTCGGALYFQSDCTVRIYNSSFRNNSLVSQTVIDAEFYEGGAITVVGSAVLDLSTVVSDSHYNVNPMKTDIVLSSSEFSDNKAQNGGAIAVKRGAKLEINSSMFCNNIGSNDGGAIYVDGIGPKYSVNISSSYFGENVATHNGGAISMNGVGPKYIVNFITSIFDNNRANGNGGAFHVFGIGPEHNVNINKCSFRWNHVGNSGGAVYRHVLGNGHSLNIISSEFVKNIAVINGGAVYTLLARGVDFNVTVSKNIFENNNAMNNGGAIDVQDINWVAHNNKPGVDVETKNGVHLNLDIIGNTFQGNEANNAGGAIYVSRFRVRNIIHTVVNGNKLIFRKNIAKDGGVVHARKISLVMSDCLLSENRAETGILYFFETTAYFSYTVVIINNTASVFLFGSNLTLTHTSSTEITNNISPKRDEEIVTFLQGGAITVFQSSVFIDGNCTVQDNHAVHGGALHVTESKVIVYGALIVVNNTAKDSGGGVHLFQSEFICDDTCTFQLIGNHATEKGGGIHAIGSLIKIKYNAYLTQEVDVNNPYIVIHMPYYTGSLVSFIANYAKLGGGICLEVNAKFYILKLFTDRATTKHIYHPLTFAQNSARYGGAVYVADNTNFGTCASSSYELYSTITECSFQALTVYDSPYEDIQILYVINFEENYSYSRGPNIFGGLLDRCTISPFDAVYMKKGNNIAIDGFTHFKSISSLNNSSTISSDAVQIYFCNDSQPHNWFHERYVQVKRGEIFIISVVAVDHVNHTINTTLQSFLLSNFGGLGEDQSFQDIGDSCTNLTFSVFSSSQTEQLILYAKGPCKDAKLSQARVSIQFLPCTCPVGFQPDTSATTKCICVCDSKLQPYVSECYQGNKTILRQGTFWISYINTSNDSNEHHYLIYPYCPLTYCYTPTCKVYIDLNAMQGSDIQCNYNRSGILCGRCKPGLSLSIGSAHCIKCSSYWPLTCTIIVVATILAEILLVFLLLELNLTVAVGTLNGIIFYANIINANISTFLPFTAPNYITIFIAWLNLEPGIDMCFFEGMDTYWKTVLQLSFPVYVIFLVVVVILVSEYSSKFFRLIGRKNPIATLATLILLSYTKLINAIITSLSFSVLEYPNGSRITVWLLDGSVGYLTGKHVFLFIVAGLILVLGTVYTVILFSWQWLIQHQRKKVFCWIRYHRLHLFLEPYHAPYTFKHRYWTGLLLLVRVILYTASAMNVSRAPGIDLLVTGVVIIGILVMKGHVSSKGCIYRKWPVDVLEVICYINIILLSLSTFYSLEAKQNHVIVAYISGTVTLVLLLIVIVYHVLDEFFYKTRLYHMFYGACFKTILENNLLRKNNMNENEIPLIEHNPAKDQPTTSWVDTPAQSEQLPLECDKERDESIHSQYYNHGQLDHDKSHIPSNGINTDIHEDRQDL